MSARAGKRSLYTFDGYCRCLALGAGGIAAMARNVRRIKGKQPSQKRKFLATVYKRGMMSEGDYRDNLDRIERMQKLHKQGFQTHTVDTTNRGQWQPLGNGGHVRRTHTGGDMRVGVVR